MQIEVGIYMHIIVLVLYQVNFMLVTLLKIICSSLQLSNVLALAVHSERINFVFQIFPPFVPKMPTAFTSCLLQVISIQ
jgi:hypothetical protein